MICGKSILFFKSGFLVKRRQLDDKIENKIARYLSMHTNTTLPWPAVSCLLYPAWPRLEQQKVTVRREFHQTQPEHGTQNGGQRGKGS